MQMEDGDEKVRDLTWFDNAISTAVTRARIYYIILYYIVCVYMKSCSGTYLTLGRHCVLFDAALYVVAFRELRFGRE